MTDNPRGFGYRAVPWSPGLEDKEPVSAMIVVMKREGAEAEIDGVVARIHERRAEILIPRPA